MLYLRRWNLLVKLKLRRVIEMTIDEAIAKYKEIANTDANCPAHCNISCDKCVQESKQLAEWLEELKSYRASVFSGDMTQKMLKEEYNKAIDDLLGGMNQITYNCQDADELFEKICDLAEQLKAGGVNE